MSAELIAIIAASVSLGGLVTVQIAGVRADLRDAARDRADLRDRVARMEGALSTLQDALLRRDADRGAA